MASPLDLVAAYADSSALQPFDGRDVVRSQIQVTNTGDGLSAAMAVSPDALHHGQEVVIIMRGTVSRVGFVPVDASDDDSALIRVHTIKAGTAVIADDAVEKRVAKALDSQADRIKKAIEATKGIERLPGVDDAPDGEEDGEEDDLADPTPIR